MPEAAFDQNLNLPSNTSSFVKLAKKGDKIKFRIANTPHYETIHWIGNKEFVLCGRFNGNDPKAPCQYCEQYLKLRDEGKKDMEIGVTPQTNFYYPILNLDTGKPAIFQFKAKQIHYNIKGYADEGVDVFGCDWSVERTEEQGNYYKILRLGDKPLSKDLQEQYEIARKQKLKARESNSVVLEQEEEEPIPSEE